MQVNIFTPNYLSTSQTNRKTPNFGMVYKEFKRDEFKSIASELEKRIGIFCKKANDKIQVVFATVPNTPEEAECIEKYNAQKIKPIDAKTILGNAVSMVQENFGKLKSEVLKPDFIDTKIGMNPYSRRTHVSKSRIEGFTNPPKN